MIIDFNSNRYVNYESNDNSKRLLTIDLDILRSEKIISEIYKFVGLYTKNEKRAPTCLDVIVRSIRVFLSFLNEHFPTLDSLTELKKIHLDEYSIFLNKTGQEAINKRGISDLVSTIPFKLIKYINYDLENIYNNSTWYLHLLSDIDPSRITRRNVTFKFDLQSKKNNEILKEYTWDLLHYSNLKISTIYNRFCSIRHFLNIINENLFKLPVYNIVNIINNYSKKYILRKNIMFNDFFKFLYTNDHIDEKIKLDTKIFSKVPTKSNPKYISDFVKIQILEILSNEPLIYKTAVLILISTGMRISELSKIKSKDIFQNSNGYFIQFLPDKFEDEVVNPIPFELYLMMTELSIENRESYRFNDYLFPSVQGGNLLPANLGLKIKSKLDNREIYNRDGTLYYFRAHDFRHTFASDCVEENISIFTIQNLLHHKSPSMTLKYVQCNLHRKFDETLRYIELSKYPETVFEIPESSSSDNNVGEIVAGGKCSLPCDVSICTDSSNNCFSCDHFNSDNSFVEVHLNQLEDINKFLEENDYIEDGVLYETNLRTKDNLEKLLVEILVEVKTFKMKGHTPIRVSRQ